MLYLKTVERDTLSLLKTLQNLPELNKFSLVGGTALSLKFGHRISIDLDLFGELDFNKENLMLVLRDKFGDDFVPEVNPTKWAIFSFIKGIKVDIVSYKHPLVEPI